MKKTVMLNIMLNFGLMISFVLLNNYALKKALEETFVLLALIYGVIVILINAFFVARFCKK